MLLRDIGHALRNVLPRVGIRRGGVLIMMLRLGTNTALPALLEAVLLRPLPYDSADDLVLIKHRHVRSGLSKHDIAIGDFVDRGRSTF